MFRRDWAELAASIGNADVLVEIASIDRETGDIIHASLRTDRYLCIPLGVVDWLYVSRLARGKNISTYDRYDSRRKPSGRLI